MLICLLADHDINSSSSSLLLSSKLSTTSVKKSQNNAFLRTSKFFPLVQTSLNCVALILHLLDIFFLNFQDIGFTVHDIFSIFQPPPSEISVSFLSVYLQKCQILQ